MIDLEYKEEFSCVGRCNICVKMFCKCKKLLVQLFRQYLII